MSIWTQRTRPVKPLSVPWSSLTGVALSRPRSVRLVGGEDHRHGVLDATLADLVAVDVERDVAALGQSAAVVGELHADLVLAGGDGLLPVDLEALEAEEVVAVGRAPLVEVEAPAGVGAALGDDHSLAAPLRHLDLRP